MPRFPTYPTLYDKAQTLSITDLKGWCYLKPGQWRTGIVTWSRGERKTGSIRVSVELGETSGFLELEYQFRDEPIKYKVPIVSKPSNLGKGLIWFFCCPHTGKRCRKLYGIGKYFLHREAFRGCMYERQTRSKKSRALSKALDISFAPEDFRREGKQLRRYYNGKPTKRYLKYLEIERKAVAAAKGFNIMDFF